MTDEQAEVRLIARDPDGPEWWAHVVGEGTRKVFGFSWIPLYPVLTDDATAGILLGMLAKERPKDPLQAVRPRPYADEPEDWVMRSDRTRASWLEAPEGFCLGEAVAKALLIAWEITS